MRDISTFVLALRRAGFKWDFFCKASTLQLASAANSPSQARRFRVVFMAQREFFSSDSNVTLL
jgi:hypothetical protein